MAATPGRDGLRAWRAFLEAHAAVTRRLEAELERETGLPLAWYDVLVQLSEAPGGALRMQELARSVLLSKSGVSRLVDRIEAAGFVRRGPCDDDRRGTLASLTPAGRRALRRAAPVHLRGIGEHFARHLGAREAAALAGMLSRLAAAAGGPDAS